MIAFTLCRMFWQGAKRVYDEKYDVAWPIVYAALSDARNDDMTVTLRVAQDIEIGPQELSLKCEAGNYLLTFLLYTAHGPEVRSLDSVTTSTDLVEIHGERWSPSFVTTDFALVVAAFKEMYTTGDVSQEILK